MVNLLCSACSACIWWGDVYLFSVFAYVGKSNIKKRGDYLEELIRNIIAEARKQSEKAEHYANDFSKSEEERRKWLHRYIVNELALEYIAQHGNEAEIFIFEQFV